MRFRPLHDRVVIERIEQEERTAGGIIIPDTAQEKPMEGEIVAVGPGARSEDGKLHPLDVEVGDRVLFGKWSGTEVKIDDEEYISGVRAVASAIKGEGQFTSAIWVVGFKPIMSGKKMADLAKETRRAAEMISRKINEWSVTKVK